MPWAESILTTEGAEMTFDVEEIGTDPRTSDGLVILFAIQKPAKLTGVLIFPATAPKAVALKKLRLVIDSHPTLKDQLRGFTIEPRTVGKIKRRHVFEIKFAVPVGTEEETIPLFLEYLRQCNIVTNPLGCDSRDFEVENK